MSEEFEVKEPCPCCGKIDLLVLRPCILGAQYHSDVFCKRCGVKIGVDKWNIRAPNSQVKLLRDALKLVDDHDEMHTQSWFDCGYHKIVDNALSETE